MSKKIHTHTGSGHTGTGSYHGGYNTNYGTAYTTSYKACEHAILQPIKVGDTFLYASARRDIPLAIKAGFDVISPLIDTSALTEFKSYYGLLLWFPIGDMTAPEPVRLRIHAQRLIALARAGNKVVTHCEGGHGRTGTVLATCIGLLEPDVDPIDEIRSRYCKEACETYKQIEAVFVACGREVPERWKESNAFKKFQPTWAQQGLGWSTTGKDVTNDLVEVRDSDKWTCDVCKEFGGTGKDKLHWYGHLRAHSDCYSDLQKKWDESNKATGKLESNKTPSADSPPVTVSNTQKNALPIGGYPSGGTVVDVVDDDTDIEIEIGEGDDDEDEDLVQARPFFYRWSEKQQKKYRLVNNERDKFGDLICPLCEYLITDPYAARKNVGTSAVAVHIDCKVAKEVLNNCPLCEACYTAYAPPESGSLFCAECQAAKKNLKPVKLHKIATDRQTYPAIYCNACLDKTLNTAPLTNSEHVVELTETTGKHCACGAEATPVKIEEVVATKPNVTDDLTCACHPAEDCPDKCPYNCTACKAKASINTQVET